MTGELVYEATVRVKATKLAGLQEFYNYVFEMPMRLDDPERRIESFEFELEPEVAQQLAMSLFSEKNKPPLKPPPQPPPDRRSTNPKSKPR